jgi:hypothetical protein
MQAARLPPLPVAGAPSTSVDVLALLSVAAAMHDLCPADFKPVQRELVIDIDMTDYDELRTCGSGGHICSRCWPFIAVAIQVGRYTDAHCNSSRYVLVDQRPSLHQQLGGTHGNSLKWHASGCSTTARGSSMKDCSGWKPAFAKGEGHLIDAA